MPGDRRGPQIRCRPRRILLVQRWSSITYPFSRLTTEGRVLVLFADDQVAQSSRPRRRSSYTGSAQVWVVLGN